VGTFSGLHTAYSGTVAARYGLDVVGQNIANANTAGYTRQRVLTSAVGVVPQTGMFTGGGFRIGQGVSVDGIARMGNDHLDGQVRFTAGAAGYSAIRATAMKAVETSLHEPGKDGLSADLQAFWSAWQELSNNAGESAQSGLLLGQAKTVASHIATNYQSVDKQWSDTRDTVVGAVAELNQAASDVAELNGRIRQALIAGENANELLDQRNTLTTTIAALTGGSVRAQPDGTVDVLVGGNAVVSGTTAHRLDVRGSAGLDGVAADPVRLVWAGRPGIPVSVEGGEIAGGLSLLAPANGGTGGALAETAASYNRFAADLADKVNAIHSAGVTHTGAPGGNFFAYGANAASSLTVIPTGADQIATGTNGAGPKDGSVADRIAQLGKGPDSPSKVWSDVVTSIGVATKVELRQASLSDLASNSAVKLQLSNSAVDLDEENVNMLTFQHAYQGAARVMTAVDEMLDTLINRTGLVGR
jgi:flagellar hook-associated protein 1 FlgK